MPKIADATFSGTTKTYNFDVYPINTTFRAVGAVYIFTKRTVDASGKGSHSFLYIGQTGSLADRIPDHEKWPCVNRQGANCICIHRDDDEASRVKKESDLLTKHRMPCNDE